MGGSKYVLVETKPLRTAHYENSGLFVVDINTKKNNNAKFKSNIN